MSLPPETVDDGTCARHEPDLHEESGDLDYHFEELMGLWCHPDTQDRFDALQNGAEGALTRETIEKIFDAALPAGEEPQPRNPRSIRSFRVRATALLAAALVAIVAVAIWLHFSQTNATTTVLRPTTATARRAASAQVPRVELESDATHPTNHSVAVRVAAHWDLHGLYKEASVLRKKGFASQAVVQRTQDVLETFVVVRGAHEDQLISKLQRAGYTSAYRWERAGGMKQLYPPPCVGSRPAGCSALPPPAARSVDNGYTWIWPGCECTAQPELIECTSNDTSRKESCYVHLPYDRSITVSAPPCSKGVEYPKTLRALERDLRFESKVQVIPSPNHDASDSRTPSVWYYFPEDRSTAEAMVPVLKLMLRKPNVTVNPSKNKSPAYVRGNLGLYTREVCVPQTGRITAP